MWDVGCGLPVAGSLPHVRGPQAAWKGAQSLTEVITEFNRVRCRTLELCKGVLLSEGWR